MTLFFADLVREESLGTGTGDLALGGAPPGFRTFAAAVPAGARFHYCIGGIDHPGQWETGVGEIGSGNTLVRMPLSSSVGGSAVAFSAGRKAVTLTVAAAWYTGQEQGIAGVDDVPGLEAALDARAPANHSHAPSDIDGVEAALEGKAAAEHGHDTGEVTGLQAALDGKAANGHGHGIADVMGLDAALAAKQPLDAELTAFAALASGADKLPYFTGAGAAALAGFSGFGRSLVDDADAAAARSTLGLGAAATKGIGTSGEAVPLLNGAATSWASGAIFGGALARDGGFYLEMSGAFPQLFFDANDYFSFDRAANNYTFNVGNSLIANMNAGGFNTQGSFFVDGTQVVTNRRTGWGNPTGTATRNAFATGTVTTAQLAERVKALIDDLSAHGLIGS